MAFTKINYNAVGRRYSGSGMRYSAPATGKGKFFTFRIDGAAELEKALEQLPVAMSRAVLRVAAIRALRPVLEAAQSNANSAVNRHTGKFQGSFQITTKLSKRQQRNARRYNGLGDVNVYVGSTDQKAHLIEFGTKHMAPRPVMRPAWDENKQEVYDRFIKEISVQLSKAAKKLAKKAIKGTLTAKERQALR